MMADDAKLGMMFKSWRDEGNNALCLESLRNPCNGGSQGYFAGLLANTSPGLLYKAFGKSLCRSPRTSFRLELEPADVVGCHCAGVGHVSSVRCRNVRAYEAIVRSNVHSCARYRRLQP